MTNQDANKSLSSPFGWGGWKRIKIAAAAVTITGKNKLADGARLSRTQNFSHILSASLALVAGCLPRKTPIL